MTNDDRRRMMEFILEQQAQFSANIQQHEEYLKEMREERKRDRPRMVRLEKSFQNLTELCRIYDIRLDDVEAGTSDLKAEALRLEESVRRFDRLVEKNRARLDRLESRS